MRHASRWLLLVLCMSVAPAWAASVGLVASPFQRPGAGDDIVVAVTGADLDGATSLDLTYGFDPAVMTPTGVFTTAYSHGAALSYSFATPGTVEIHLAKGTPFTGGGNLAWVMFRVAPGVSAGTTTPLAWVQASLNAGTIPCLPQNTTVAIGPGPVKIAAPWGAFGPSGSQVLVPITVSALGAGSSFDLTVTFDPHVLSAASVQTPPFASCMSMASNVTQPGTVRISMFGLCSLSGTGPLAMILFNVVGPHGSRTPIDVTRGSVDEGASSSVLEDGLFNACATADADGDGYSLCAGDCDDLNAARHPGAVEFCNAIDDDCDITVDNAAPPRGTPSLHIDEVNGDAFLSWPSVPQATAYDVLRGDVSILHAQGLTASIDTCLGSRIATSSLVDNLLPAAGNGFWYLTRAANCGGAGTYDEGGGHQVPRDVPAGLSAITCP